MATVHLQLGRSGDLIILLPCWHQIWRDTGQKPVVIVAREFAGVFRGVSYVEPDVVNGHWYASVVPAAQMARIKYKQFVITQCHGVGHETDQAKYPTFGEAMWSKAGFGGRYGELPLVFDRRNQRREEELIRRYVNGKPTVLFNFSGLSSPLGAGQEIRHRLRRWERKFHLVNLGAIKAEYIYDLLGLYDVTAGLISIDTATVHLAAASKVKLLAYCRGGWSSAVPKAGAVRVEYGEAHLRLDVVDEFMESLKA